MIVVVKAPNYKKILLKVLSFGIFGAILVWYYFESEKKVIAIQEQQKQTNVKDKFDERAKKLEKLILKEAEISVELLNQAKVQSVSVIDDKLLIVCDNDTELEPLMVRYGAMALIKNSSQNIKIAIDLAYLLESKYEES